MTDPATAGLKYSRGFYVWMAAICFAIAVVGFIPTYFVPLARGTFQGEPMIHVHALALLSWMMFVLTQAWLAARGAIVSHRTWGMLGIAIFTAMTLVVLAVVSLRIMQAALPGQPAGLLHDVKAFAWVSVSILMFVVPTFIVAIANITRPEIHKRLMLLLTIALLGPPIARFWRLASLGSPLDPSASSMEASLPDVSVPPVDAAIPPALAANLLLVVAMAFDWRTRGNIHPAYLIGGAILLLFQLTLVPVAESTVWQAIADAIGHIAG